MNPLPAWVVATVTDPKYQFGAALVLVGHPATRRVGIDIVWHLTKETARFHWRATAGTGKIIGKSMGITRVGAAQATAAVVVPVIAGYGISHAIAGHKGTQDYVDFMSGKVSPQKWFKTVFQPWGKHGHR